MKSLIAMIFISCFALAELPAYAAEFSNLQAKSQCLSANDYLQCRKSKEQRVLTSTGGKATRSGLSLRLKAANGKTKAYKDDGTVVDGASQFYMLEHYLPEAGFFVVEAMCEGTASYSFVSAADGKVKATGTSHPQASPSGDKLMMLDDAYKQGSGTLFQVWVPKQHGQLAWEAKIEVPVKDIPYEGASAQWNGANEVIIKGENSRYKATFNGNKWTVKKSK